jgi:hypothetical protein
VLRVETRRSVVAVRLGGHTLVRSGERIGVLHLDNARVAALHEDGRPPMAVGLEFRRLLIESLGALAADARDGQRLAGLSAFTAVTIFHPGLRRLGFETQRNGLVWPRVTALYQRALLGSLHPDGVRRLHRAASTCAERLWISRDRLLALYDGARVRRYAGSPGR